MPDDIAIIQQTLDEADHFCTTQECLDNVNLTSGIFGVVSSTISALFGVAIITGRKLTL